MSYLMEKSMKKLILIALAVSIITGFAVFQFASSLKGGSNQKTQPVVVAVETIAKGTMILPEMITVKQVPVDFVNALSVSNGEDVTGRITRESIEADEQILSTRLSDVNQANNSLSYAVDQNYRAMTIQTDEITGVAGYISKGDHVDLIATMINSADESKRVMSQTVIENVEVLEVGSKETTKSGDAATSVTVLVPVQSILKVNYALTEGKYRLILRSPVDGTIANPAPYAP
ncbi:Flp pilus assembly protein CpaB [Acetobacterium paludosum]|uniref:Flp pilus assembly protein CpaB n=2 Tax=Acetobacterium paludosum TaxID=52693 RepID=A0A923I4N4_9FIRM|nr:Flp pilus assembly protein CpaB [Acetobacterium paludosum]